MYNISIGEIKVVIIITGASSGIGKETAIYLAKKGHKVYGLSRTICQNQHFESLSCDITNFDMVKQTFEQIFEKEGKIDVLVNNAGMGISGAVEQTSDADIKKQFDLNLFALINACKMITPILRKCGGGKIVNIGSVAGVIPIPFQTFYSVSKASVDMFTMAFGLEVRDFGIQTCVVMPGDTKTGFTDSRIKTLIEQDEVYGDRISQSVCKMESDEKNGKPPISVSKVVYKVIKKRKMPSRKTVGFSYKLIILLEKLLPRRLMLWVVKKIYG